jgi:hypothetical protein
MSGARAIERNKKKPKRRLNLKEFIEIIARRL